MIEKNDNEQLVNKISYTKIASRVLQLRKMKITAKDGNLDSEHFQTSSWLSVCLDAVVATATLLVL